MSLSIQVNVEEVLGEREWQEQNFIRVWGWKIMFDKNEEWGSGRCGFYSSGQELVGLQNVWAREGQTGAAAAAGITPILHLFAPLPRMRKGET